MNNLLQINLHNSAERRDGFEASVILEHNQMKIRRIELAAGAKIPPCQMQEDVVFVVISGQVTFRAEQETALVEAPYEVFIPGGATTRSMEAHEPSLVLAVLCRRGGLLTDSEGSKRL